jgi:peroxiredoxin (alkyl hydroperoxide reductase subunit C)
VLAISTDSHHTHLAWSRTSRKDGGVGQLNIPLVADTSKKISAAYGVLVTDEEDEMFGAALRGLFIIGKVSLTPYMMEIKVHAIDSLHVVKPTLQTLLA